MTKVNVIYFMLLSVSVLVLFYFGGQISIVEDGIFRLKQPAYALDNSYILQQTLNKRTLKTGNFLEDNVDAEKQTLKTNQEKVKYQPHSSTQSLIIKTSSKLIKGSSVNKSSSKHISRQRGEQPLFSISDLQSDNPERYGMKLAMSHLNYEFSSNHDPSNANLPTFHPLEFQPGDANKMEIVGNIKVGEDIPVKSARHILIATTWRSGSSFLGDLLNHYPGSFYYFEPLHYYSQVTDKTNLRSEHDFLNSLYNCTFDKSNLGFLHHVKKPNNKFLFKNHNFRLWNSCKNILPKEMMCLESSYLAKLCPRYPIKLMKTVRLRVSKVESLLKNSGLDLKVVVLVRDPRGVYNSRSSGVISKWCNVEGTCSDPAVGCKDLLDDIRSAADLENRFPGTVRIVRYEDLSLFPEETTRGMLKFLDLPWHSAIDYYIDKHTSREKSKLKRNKKTGKMEKLINEYSTTRDSSVTAFAWKDKLEWKKMVNIQEVCSEPMAELGYKLVKKYEDTKSADLPIEKTANEVWPYN